MSDCLVTKLKGVVNDDYLPKMGDMKISYTLRSGFSGKNYFTLGVNGGFEAFVPGDGNLVNSQGSIIGKRNFYSGNSATVYLDNDVRYLVIHCGYNLTSISSLINTNTIKGVVDAAELYKYRLLTNVEVREGSCLTLTGKLSDLANIRSLKRLILQDSAVTGDLSDLSPLKDVIEYVGIPGSSFITGDVSSLSEFSKLTQLSLKGPLKTTGDLSSLPAITYYAALDIRSKYTWVKGRPTNAVIMVILDGNLGEYVDAALNNLAQCQDWAPSNKTISLYGTRTSASDEAVAKLQGMGWTVSVTEA